MMQVFLHLGFHKTATSSAQAFLHENRELIWPRAALALPGRMRAVSHAVFEHCFARNARSAEAITAAMRAFLSGLTLGPKRRLIISAENLLGPMPLGLDPAPYPAAGESIAALLAAFEVFDWPVEVTLYFSTRAQASWVESIWAHQARKDQLVPFCEDLESFRAGLDQMPLRAQLARICAALPGQKVVSHDVSEFASMRFGAGQPFVDFLSLPRDVQDQFVAVPARNVAPPRAVTEELIALNRVDLLDAELAAAKRAVLQRAGLIAPEGETF
ncbi:hypothetical protein [Rhodobacter maris]|uniref:Sulfotransferase family protein n=1 Tax=Rhodobacter maris TaxID=446682 RepID=A0A285RKE9_9RHOB|nr:hypothetical protein [Rhodobacter maris]SOB94573.1 hypothetical protein SAMN05877831_101518 [Rhodobacter maris]